MSSAEITAMVAWEKVESGTDQSLYQISQTPLGVTSLEWSPDGRHLWLNIASGSPRISSVPVVSLVVDVNRHQAWVAGQSSESPCFTPHDWSPDGRQLAYLRDGQLWLADADGQNRHPLPSPPDAEGLSSPRYSPDGRRIAGLATRIEDDGAHHDLWLLDVAAGTWRRLVEDAGSGQFTWSPAGDAVAHLGARLWIAEVTSGRTISADLGSLPRTEVCLNQPAWLMDGDKALATIPLTSGVWTVSRDGQVERLDEQPQSDLGGHLSGLPISYFAGGPCDGAVASPDGRFVVYTVGGSQLHVLDLHTGVDLALGRGDLCHGVTPVVWAPATPQFIRWSRTLELVDATDGSVRQLASSGRWPAWSPDGVGGTPPRIAYWQPEADGYALWLLNLDTMEATRLTSSGLGEPQPARYMTPHWSPDGRSIAFVAIRDKHPEAYLLRLR